MMKYLLIALAVLMFPASLLSQIPDTLFFEHWESGIGSWYADNGVWEVGNPTVGPDSGFMSENCAGTILGGNYPAYANTHLISSFIALPSILPDESIQLKLWHWFRLQQFNSIYPYPYDPDKGQIQISVNGGNWQNVGTPFTGISPVWTQVVLDLSAYADSTIRLAFYFTSTPNNEDNGWYIDNILIEKLIVTPGIPDDFELGVGDWGADNGLWQVGVPTTGPTSAHSGQNVAGTILGGNYPAYAGTRLISSKMTLPPNESLQLKFWQWFYTEEYNSTYPYPYDPDLGRIQISVNNGGWQTIAGTYSGISTLWTQVVVDLSAYADSTVRFAFYFTSTGNNQNMGWYIDDVSIETGPFTFLNPDSFELGVDSWSADNGLWQVGTPIIGPDSAHSGQYCAGTVLEGNYPSNANTRLISPEITLTTQSGQFPGLFFWHWFRLQEYSSIYPYPYDPDEGRIQVSVNGGIWQTVGGPITGISPVWTQYYVDLSAFVDSTVRIAFYFTSSGNNEDNGWYIDDIRIDNIEGIGENDIAFPNKFFLYQNYPNPFNPVTHIRFSLPKASDIKIKVYNTIGQEVAVLLDERKPAGTHVVDFDGSNLGSGVYFYKIEASSFQQVKKMLLLK